MTIRKLTLTGVLTAVGLAATADRAAAQVNLAPGGVQIGGSAGTGLYVPFSGGVRNATITSPYGAYQPSTGATYAPYSAYNTTPAGVYTSPASGTFSTYQPSGFYNYGSPVGGTSYVNTTPSFNTYPGTTGGTVYGYPRVGYSYPSAGWTSGVPTLGYGSSSGQFYSNPTRYSRLFR